MTVVAAGRRAARAAGRAGGTLLPNGQWVPDWSMPQGAGPRSGLDALEINPNRVDDIPPDVMPEDLVDPRPVVPENWEDVIPTDVEMRPGETLDNLDGAATPLNLDPTLDAPLPPRPAPNDMPGTRPSRPSPDLDDAVPNRNAAPDPSSSDARARALALATLGGAGIVNMYDFFPPGSDLPGGSPPMNPPAESPPGGDLRFDPPFPGPDGDPGNPPPGGTAQATPQMRRARVDEESRLRRLAMRAGITPAEARAMAQAGYDEQDIGHVIGKTNTSPDFDQRRQAYMTLREAGSGYQDARLADRRAEVVARAQRQYNPMATLSPEWRDMVMADRLLRKPYDGASPYDIRARELDTATQLAASAVQQSMRGGIAGQSLQLQMEQAEQQRLRDLRKAASYAGSAPVGGLLGEYTIEQKRERATRALQDQGASAEETQQIVDEMFPLPRAPGA